MPSRKQYRLLNDAEQILYYRLCEAMPNMQVFAQVGVAQLAQLRGRQESRRLAKLAGRGVDFIICGTRISPLSPPSNSLGLPIAAKTRLKKKSGVPCIAWAFR